MSASSLAQAFNRALNYPRDNSKSRSSADTEEAVKRLRRLILVDGIPAKQASALSLHSWTRRSLTAGQDPSLRPRIWKILLRVSDIPAETFLDYVARGPCEVREKIRNDTFRFGTVNTFVGEGLTLTFLPAVF
jgi:cell cycle arrest protein BUB2